MKRKLINYDVLKKIQEGSLSTAQHELTSAEDILAKALGIDDLKLHCFGESDAMYETLDGTFVHANFTLNKDQVTFENIQELVIEEDSEKLQAKKLLTGMVEALLDDKENVASDKLVEYLDLPIIRRDFIANEAFKVTVSKPSGSHSPLWHKKQNRGTVAKRVRAMIKTRKKLASSPSAKAALARKRAVMANKLGGSKNPRWRTYARKIKPGHMKEWSVMCENVINFIDYKNFGPIINESNIVHDDKGNVTSVTIPTLQKRNEGKILSFNWKTLDSEVKILRSNAKKMNEDNDFCKAMANLKRYNAISDNNGLEESLENIVSKWPQVLYLTQDELAATIKEALEIANAKNYDDKMCEFMAEGVLRMAHHAYTDRVNKIINLSGVTNEATEDTYADFKKTAETFYPTLDQTDESEMKVFSDLHQALTEVYKIASEYGDELTKSECAEFITSCESILTRKSLPNLELAENIADYLYDIAETNLDTKDWEVSNNVHMTISGDHPDMAQKAKQSYSPAADGGDYYGDKIDNVWAGQSGDSVNPYIPASYDYTMKGETGVDKDSDNGLAQITGNSYWPNLQNPAVPSAVNPRMKADNLVVDK